MKRMGSEAGERVGIVSCSADHQLLYKERKHRRARSACYGCADFESSHTGRTCACPPLLLLTSPGTGKIKLEVLLVSPPLGTNLLMYHGHMAPVNAVAWSPAGQRLASSGGTVAWTK